MVRERTQGSSVGRWLTALAGILILSVAVVAFACDDDEDGGGDPTAAPTGDSMTAEPTDPAGDESAAVEAAVQAAIDAWNAQDVEGFLAAVTDNFLLTEFEFASREEAEQVLPEFIGDPLTAGEFSDTEVSGTTAVTTALIFFGAMGAPEQFSLVLEGESWLVDSSDYVSSAVPEGATGIDVSLLEYAFNFDASAITDGNIAINLSNIGGEDHELVLLSVPAEPTLDDLVQQMLASEDEEPPEGMEFLGFVDLPPGGETSVQFQEPLAPARYVMVCFFENADGTPHVELGMVSEFTVQ